MPEQDVGKNSSGVQNQGQSGQVPSAQGGIPVKRRRPRRRRRKNTAVIAGQTGQMNIRPAEATDNQPVSILDPADFSVKTSGFPSSPAAEPEDLPAEEKKTDENLEEPAVLSNDGESNEVYDKDESGVDSVPEEVVVTEDEVSAPNQKYDESVSDEADSDDAEVIEAEVVKNVEPEKVKSGLEMADFGKRLLSLVKSLLAGIPSATVFMGGFLGRVFSGFRLRYLFMLVFVGLVVGGGYFFVYSGLMTNTYNGVMALFVPKKEEIIEVHVSENEQRMFGITTANLFAANFGSIKDYTPNQIVVADYFGRLMEPQVKGETGITAAAYFGELMDQAKDINEFVKYMENLAALQNRYKVDVYAMLDNTLKRDSALLSYLVDLKAAREKSLEMYRSIKVNIDDIKLSYDSLTPDKTKYEGDFFTAMSELQPEKSDVLLKGFVDVVQKQAALKARLGALNQLAAYYENALSKLDKRISAVEQNQEALINGIRVVDVPGGGVDVIIQPQAIKK